MKTALITGAAGGMGYAAAKKLTQEGYRVFGLDLTRPDPIPGLTFLHTDLTDPNSVEQAFLEIRSEGIFIDCIIHLAGIYSLDSLVEMSDDDFIRIFQIIIRNLTDPLQAFHEPIEDCILFLDHLVFQAAVFVHNGVLQRYDLDPVHHVLTMIICKIRNLITADNYSTGKHEIVTPDTLFFNFLKISTSQPFECAAVTD